MVKCQGQISGGCRSREVDLIHIKYTMDVARGSRETDFGRPGRLLHSQVTPGCGKVKGILHL